MAMKDDAAREKVVRNTAFNIAGRLWSGVLVQLVLTAYILARVGNEAFAIWALMAVVVSYFGAFDLGLGPAIMKHVAEFYGHKDYGRISQALSMGFVWNLLISLFMGLLGWYFAGPLVRFFYVPAGLYSDALYVFRLGIVALALSNLFSGFVGLQGGLQRMDLTNKLIIALSFVTVIGTILFLELGFGIRGLIINNLILVILTGLGNVILAYRILPQLRFHPFAFDLKLGGELLWFGLNFQVARMADIVTFQTDRIIIARFLGLGLVTPYQLGVQAIFAARQLPAYLSSALLPAASDLCASGKVRTLEELYLRSSKYVALVAFPLFLFCLSASELFISAWVGPGFEQASVVIEMLALGYLMNVVAGPGCAVAAGTGRPQLQRNSALITAFTNIVLSLILVLKLGFVGAPVATSLALIAGALYFFLRFHRYVSFGPSVFFRRVVWKPLFSSSVAALLIYWLNFGLQRSNLLGNGRGEQILLLALEGLAFLSFYALLLFRTGHLDAYDREMARIYLPSAWAIRFIKGKV